MSILEISGLRFGYKGETLFNSLDMRLLIDDHMGLIGSNGVGKSTLMNLIAHRLIPDEGKIEWLSGVLFSYLDQHLKVFDDLTIDEYLLQVYKVLFDKEQEMNDIYSSLTTAKESEYDRLLNKAYNIQEYLEKNDFYMIKSKISNVMNGLGIDSSNRHPLRNLSSGQRGKVFLAKMLLEEKDVLLLDEPTNFLDAQHVEWLSRYLTSYKHAFIVISHNTDFLNQVCNCICSLENKRIVRYKGNYEQYLKLREMREKQYNAEYESQQKYIKKTKEFIDKNITRSSTTKRAQSRRKELEKIEVIEKPVVEKKVKFEFPFTNSFNSEALVTKKLIIGYNKPLLAPINMRIYFGERMVIIGKNGVGKSTFIKTILNQIEALDGTFKMPFYNKVVYYAQEYHGDMSINAMTFIQNDYPKMDDKNIRDLLGKYGIIGELAIKPLSQLSGGELTRVRFAKLNLQSSNMLILDEPTNHLDKNAKNALCRALEEYPGTIILVSHEKEFYRKLKMKEIRFD